MQTKEPQYQIQLETLEQMGSVQMGPYASHCWRTDPRRLLFQFSRYLFCAKLLSGKSRVLEVGCSDGIGVRLMLQEVEYVHGADFDPIFIDWAQQDAQAEGLNCDFSVVDITKDSPKGRYDAAYSLDLIEHLEPEQEYLFWENICRVIEPNGVLIVGTPNITAAPYASKWSQEGHINLQSVETLRKSMEKYFYNVFDFGMNDQIPHQGYAAMRHYIFVMGVGLR